MTWIGTPGLDTLIMDGGLTTALGTITADEKNFSGTATWNAAGVTFVGMRLAITDTASAAASLLFDLQVGGNTRLSVRKDGAVTLNQGTSGSPIAPTVPSLQSRAYIAGSAGQVQRGIYGIVDMLSGTGGHPIGVWGVAQDAAGWTAGADPLIGVQGETVTSRGGDTIALGALATQTTTTGGSIQGIEVDIDARVAPTNRYGISIVANATGTAAATGEDMMLRLVNKVGGALWATGIAFANSPDFPIATTGTLIKTVGSDTIATGIDISSVTITGNAFASVGYNVDGSGRLRCGTGDVTAPEYSFSADTNTGIYQNGADVLSAAIGGAEGVRFSAPGDGETALLIRRNVAAAFTLQRVSMGIADSGGAGFKLLRVAN